MQLDSDEDDQAEEREQTRGGAFNRIVRPLSLGFEA